jgi:multidrug efflux system membrane fusion protein
MTRAILMLACGLTALGLAGCDNKPAASGPPLPAVTVSKPLQERITEWDEYTGRFVAVSTVEVRARVSGFIDSLHFKDGQIVKQGDLLFIIDQRPYKLAVDQAKAELDRTQAKLDIANLDLERATPLVRNQTVTEREFDTRKSTQRDALAATESAQATLKTAQLNLEWTEVRAPIAGRISDRRVDPGNLITGGQTGATLLTEIVTVDPIHFIFDGAEADFIRYLRLAQTGARQ